MDLRLKWRAFHIRYENIYYALILQLLQDNMNEVAKEAEKMNADDKEIIDIMNAIIDGTQLYLLLTSLFQTVGVAWASYAKNISNRDQGINERVDKKSLLSALSEWITKTTKKITIESINAQKRQVERIVDKATKEGKSNNDLPNLIRNNQYINNHALIIAQMAVLTTSNKALMEAVNQSEYLHTKTWYSQRDDRVRDPKGPINFSKYTHQDVEGVTIPTDHPFLGTHGYIMFPGDPDAEFLNTIRCRCYMSVQMPLDKNRKPIPKKMPGITVITPDRNLPPSIDSSGGITIIQPR